MENKNNRQQSKIRGEKKGKMSAQGLSLCALLEGVLSVGLRGKIGKELVFKQYRGRTIITKYPDMSGVVPSEGQLSQRSRFRAASSWSKRHMEEYKEEALGLGKAPYMYAIKKFFELGLGVRDVAVELTRERYSARLEGAIQRFIGVFMLLWMGMYRVEREEIVVMWDMFGKSRFFAWEGFEFAGFGWRGGVRDRGSGVLDRKRPSSILRFCSADGLIFPLQR